MFLKKPTRRPLAIRKDDYRLPKGSTASLPPTKYERAGIALRTPHLIEVIQRYALDFEVLESYRRKEDGENRQTTVYLATIREEHLKSSVERERFWKTIDAKLSGLKITPQDEKKIRADIQKHVPKP